MQYLMGDGAPLFRGIGERSRFVAAICRAISGTQEKARCVQSASFFVASAPLGSGMKLIVPWKRSPMYSVRLIGSLRPGCGPLRFDLEMRPLPLATISVAPSFETRTLVGYQPTGMKPRLRAFAVSSTSKTATALILALATKRR